MDKLKNYTSETPAERSISRIETILVTLGATNINKQYADGRLIAISFMILLNGNTIPFKLPARVEVVESVLLASYKKPTQKTFENIKNQSERTAWKIICDWVEIQASMIKLQQSEFMEVFLPYVYNVSNDKTFFQSMKEKNFKALLQ